MNPEPEFSGRERTRLARAREKGYLNAMCGSSRKITLAYGFWCWRLRVPLVWYERASVRSKYGRVCLDLFTTANLLNEGGRAELTRVGERLGLRGRSAVSPCDGFWDEVPVSRIEELAGAVYRTATRRGNYDLRAASPAPEVVRMFETIRDRVPLRIPA